jgi:hypothetical protein
LQEVNRDQPLPFRDRQVLLVLRVQLVRLDLKVPPVQLPLSPDRLDHKVLRVLLELLVLRDRQV